MRILLLLIILAPIVNYNNGPLFRIEENDRVGYINAQGEIVIKPVYLSGNEFSEALAAVRINGLYGFIDETGKTVIKPQFDFATRFVNGFSVVYKNGRPLFIDKRGEIALPQVYSSLTFINDQKGIITTITKKMGVIDLKSKKLIVDTSFSEISGFKHGVAIVRSLKNKKGETRVAVIDSSGNFIVPFGKFETIKQFVDGYAMVSFRKSKRQEESSEGVIDTKGNLIFNRQPQNHSFIFRNFHDGYAKISLYKYWIPEEENVSYSAENAYGGFINMKGEVVLNDTNYEDVEDFSCGRAFVSTNEGYILLDRNFQRVGNEVFDDVLNNGFCDGYAIVETEDGYGIIDTTGRFVVNPQFENIHPLGVVGKYFFYSKYEGLYGIADLTGNRITGPMMSQFDPAGFVNGLLLAIVNGRLTYINEKGKVVWQQKDEDHKLKPLNIDYMNRGYFHAYSTPTSIGEDDSGGWYSSPNKPRKISAGQFPGGQLAITIDTTRNDTFAKRYAGYKLFISNTTGDTVQFEAQDSRLYLKLQAQDRNGEWKDIEYLPNSWCGNSYHTIALNPGEFWSFTMPKYEGEIVTKIRAALKFNQGSKNVKQKTIYSNVIAGSVNPGQFWNKRQYYPSGIMDPYLE